MKEIKTSLEQLTALFARSASTEELPIDIRRFAAQLTVLTAHVRRVDEAIKVLDNTGGELAKILGAIVQQQQAGAQPTPQHAPSPPPGAEVEGPSEDEQADAMVASVLADAEREAAENTTAGKPPASITPLRPTAPAGSAPPAAPTGGAA